MVRFWTFWYAAGIVAALGYIQDVRRSCSVDPNGWRVMSVAAMGPLGIVLVAIPGSIIRCERFAVETRLLASDKRQTEVK